MPTKKPLRKNQRVQEPGPAIENVNPELDDDEFEDDEEEITGPVGEAKFDPVTSEQITPRTPDEEEADPNDVSGNEDPAGAGIPEAEDPAAPAYQERFPGAPRGAAVFESGENIIVKAKTQGDLIVVEEPVYRATKSPGSRRWRFHLLYSKGATMSKTKAKLIGRPANAEERKQAWPYEVKDSGYFSA